MRVRTPLRLINFGNLGTVFGLYRNETPTRSERRLLKHWIPVSKEELEQVSWWMGLNEREYHFQDGVGFMLPAKAENSKGVIGELGRRCVISPVIIRHN